MVLIPSGFPSGTNSVLYTFLQAIISILNMAARVSFTIHILTVTNKLLHLENHFVDVSTVLLHKMYYSISAVYLESLTQKNQTFLHDFFINFVFFL